MLSPATPDGIAFHDSVRLFVDRVRLHQPSFGINEQNAHAVASVCARLEGIPLALELAAARVRSMTVQEMDGRLNDHLRLRNAVMHGLEVPPINVAVPLRVTEIARKLLAWDGQEPPV